MGMYGDFLGYMYYSLGYIVYRIVDACVSIAQKITCSPIPRYEQSCHVMRIVWKRKFFMIDVVSPSDFIAFHETYTDPSYVLKETVSLYCLTKNEAVFIEVPESVDIYGQEKNPFQYIAQFKHATKVLHVPMTSFLKMASILGDPVISVCYMANTGRCGSTILSQALANVPGTLLLAEPDCLTNLGHLWKDGSFTHDEYEESLVATVRVLCKPRHSVERIIIKTRSCATCHIDTVAEHFPKVKFIFGYRNSMATVSSFLGLMLSETAQSASMYLIDNELFSWIIPFFRRRMYFYFCYMLDRPALRNADTMNTVAQFTYAWANCICWVRDFQEKGVHMLPILYRDMIDNQEDTCRMVLRELDIDEKHTDAMLVAFRQDSQHGSVLSRTNIANATRRKVGAKDKLKADQILAEFGLPALGDELKMFTK